MASDVSPNWLRSVPVCTSFVAGCQALAPFVRSLFAAIGQLHSRNRIPTGLIKKPGLWLPPKDRDRLEDRLARPFSDLFNVAASRPAKSPRGAINAPAERVPSSLCRAQPAETAKRKQMTAAAPSR